ncbi:bifunctional adenosylcobinamide kinase/adenosylcobinamide-phosphate guanylyltransferase [Paenibacillus methanolicus]|uniref:Adenosylcobinamide kinase n=1 Tax=Paenibacillus methanolicus TaxID=582686 RepID=A0A5S5CFU5_9BACL|nr:bifunctional adenosylcobinamide kinase/adenosylcobinamide-phosphate guanylyltransferase [Paenibacillus methanolicus]TYP77558.1 adenosylcobinamide kinase/adenosylcobinamide-phosphate guanylyltransferase [Paenibacillus methanolicus]
MAIFITGGARSGKSDFAERYAMRLAAGAVYIATSQIWDEEMRQRIGLHRSSRAASGYSWRTIEEPFGLAETLQTLEEQFSRAEQRPAVVVDCLTLWLSNQLLRLEPADGKGDPASAEANEAVQTEVTATTKEIGENPDTDPAEDPLDGLVDQLAAAVAAYRGPLLLVTNEVGSGIVPAYALGRRFRDAAGRMNRKLASVCEEAYLVVAGFPLDLKKLAFRLEDA